MTKKFYNLPRMYSTTTGDSDATLTTAVPGCKTFEQAGFSSSDELNYGIITYDTATHRPTGTEVGLGKYLSSDSDGGPYLQRTTVYSSISLDSDDTEDANITLTGLSEIYCPWLKEDILTIQEADSDPAVYPVNKIIVSNGTLTDNGNGVVTVTTGGGGGGEPFAIFDADTLGVDSVDTANTLDHLTINRELVDDGNIASVDSAFEITVSEAGWYNIIPTLWYRDITNFGNGYIDAYIDSTSAYAYAWPQSIIQTAADSARTQWQITFSGPMEFAGGDKFWISLDNYSGGTINIGVVSIVLQKLGA